MQKSKIKIQKFNSHDLSTFALADRQNRTKGQSMFTLAERQNRTQGQSMFELIVALAIGIIIVTAVVVVSSNSVRNSSFSKNNAAAARYAQEGMEWLRSQRDQSWSTIYAKASVAGYDWCLQMLAWPGVNGACTSNQTISGTVYTRQLNMKLKDYAASPSSTDNETVEATMVVTWSESGTAHNVTLTSQFTNWKIK
jgi:Tfp pilus assembly protein PilV